MENKGVLIGSIVFVFASFILTIVGLVYESHKAKQMKELALSIKTESKPLEVIAPRDFSIYKTLVGDDGREMIQIPEGPFVVGSKDGDPDEAPEHQAYLSTYYIDKKEVTQGEYDRFTKATKKGKPFIPVFEDDQSKILKPELPAIGMSWTDAEAYCRWAGKRLPTEAEWEKAVRGGSESKRYPWGDRLDRNMANFLADPALKPTHGTTPCRSYPPNDFGLFDMAGNVWEWVHDWYDPRFYGTGSVRNPTGPPLGKLRLLRGGSWLVADVRMLSCSYRHKVPPDSYSYGIGFRVACSR